MPRRVALLVTGASGMLLPAAVLRALAGSDDVERVHLVVSAGASQVLKYERPEHKPGANGLLEVADLVPEWRQRVVVHRDNELGAPIASGSYRLDGALVVPCSGSTLGALATGAGRTLVHRTGDVALKERWPLVLAFRETPLSVVHLENLRRLAYAGAIVMPPMPAFYLGESMATFVDAFVARCLDHVGLSGDVDDALRWSPDG